ncbi:hypothetical protein Rm378p028 [Rhodothermus phage RM378]|uniref:hypothetical protein n=1 Tax=Rhodothermus phage RM378 TaxID=148943 RepID=UPI000018F626|nr:hypothetical protein Rm378p028 [Rhodothermus phage RM378]
MASWTYDTTSRILSITVSVVDLDNNDVLVYTGSNYPTWLSPPTTSYVSGSLSPKQFDVYISGSTLNVQTGSYQVDLLAIEQGVSFPLTSSASFTITVTAV